MGDNSMQEFECAKVPCGKPGWICSCEGREFVCPVKRIEHPTYLREMDGKTYCNNMTSEIAEPPVLRLGSLEIGLSRKGMVSNACNELVWFYNGEFMVNYGDESNPEINCANVDYEIDRRANHTSIELKRGDLIAFRFKHASYHCFTSIAKFQVNGKRLSSMHKDVVIRYATKHTPGWHHPSFKPMYPKNNESVYNVTEETEEPGVFVPLRREFLETGENIIPGKDYWHPPDGGRDHKLGNFYFRIQL